MAWSVVAFFLLLFVRNDTSALSLFNGGRPCSTRTIANGESAFGHWPTGGSTITFGNFCQSRSLHLDISGHSTKRSFVYNKVCLWSVHIFHLILLVAMSDEESEQFLHTRSKRGWVSDALSRAPRKKAYVPVRKPPADSHTADPALRLIPWCTTADTSLGHHI